MDASTKAPFVSGLILFFLIGLSTFFYYYTYLSKEYIKPFFQEVSRWFGFEDGENKFIYKFVFYIILAIFGFSFLNKNTLAYNNFVFIYEFVLLFLFLCYLLLFKPYKQNGKISSGLPVIFNVYFLLIFPLFIYLFFSDNPVQQPSNIGTTPKGNNYSLFYKTALYIVYFVTLFLFYILYFYFDKFKLSFMFFFQSFWNMVQRLKINIEQDISKIWADDNIKKEVINETMQIIPLILFLKFIIIVSIIAMNDNTSSSRNMNFYLFMLIVPLMIGLYITRYLINTSGKESSLFFKISIIGVLFFFILCGVFYFYSINPLQFVIAYSIFYIIFALIAIIGLAIVFILFAEYFKNMDGIIGIFVNILFFIPCLFSDFIEYVKHELNITPSTIYILFLFEIGLVLLYYYIPTLFKYFISRNSTVLLDSPQYLDKPKRIADSSVFQLANMKFLEKDTYKTNNHSFSFWIYMNKNEDMQLPKTQSHIPYEYTLFHYITNGTTSPVGGKPKVVYINDKNNFMNTYRIYVNSDETCISSDTSNNCFVQLENIPIQRWNFFVINFQETVVDIFVNGELAQTAKTNIRLDVISNENASVLIGDENGIDGAICNVYYHHHPLSLFEIVNMYNIEKYSVLNQ